MPLLEESVSALPTDCTGYWAEGSRWWHCGEVVIVIVVWSEDA